MYAAKYGHLECLKILAPLEKGMKKNDGWTALMFALEYGHLECVKVLAPLEKGMKNNYGGRTALMDAAENGHLECIKVLAPLEKGMQDNYGSTALMDADMNGHLECVKILAGEEEERKASQFTDLITAAVCGDAEGVQQHISQAGQKDANGMTALMYAAREGHLECV